ncbi:hypothetical protein ABZ912_14575 [Nonomuraea angiospora]|uniref:hypothetical protein n=1 Tax=Nonomuraea angiospora TaxID=46172 RepID=UPI0033ED8FC3
MTTLVTGATGNTGRHVVTELLLGEVVAAHHWRVLRESGVGYAFALTPASRM